MSEIRAPLTPISDDDLPDTVISQDSLKENSISTDKIVAGSITTEKIAAGAITADKITLTIDDISDGTNYGRTKKASLTADGLVMVDNLYVNDTDGTYGLVRQTDLSAGHLYISSYATYQSGYDPSEKAKKNAVNATIYTSVQPAARNDSTPLQEGDIWINTSDGDRPYRYTNGSWQQQFTLVDGGHVKTGVIEDSLGRSWINLNDGTFSFGLGSLSWDGSKLNVVGDIQTSTNSSEQRIVLSSQYGTLDMYDDQGNNILYIDTSNSLPVIGIAGNLQDGYGVRSLGRIHFDTAGVMYVQSTYGKLQIDAGTSQLLELGALNDIIIDSGNAKVQIDNGIYMNGGHLYSNGTNLYFTDSNGTQHTII